MYWITGWFGLKGREELSYSAGFQYFSILRASLSIGMNSELVRGAVLLHIAVVKLTENYSVCFREDLADFAVE